MARRTRKQVEDAVMRAIRSYFEEASNLDQAIADRAGIARSDVRCLSMLDIHGGRMTAGKLAQLTYLTTGAVTGVLDRLERAGLAHRIADPGDSRRVFVETDPAARARGRHLFNPLVRAQREELSRYSEHELALLDKFLKRIAAQVAERTAVLRDEGDIGAGSRAKRSALRRERNSSRAGERLSNGLYK